MNAMLGELKKRVVFNPLMWLEYTRRMRAQVRDAVRVDVHPRPDAPHFAVVLSPWLGTGVPWFSAACGLLLASEGARVTFIVDDFQFGDNTIRFRVVVACIRMVARLLRVRYRVESLSRVAPPPADGDAEALVQRLAALNAVWALRGELVTSGRSEYTRTCRDQLLHAYPAIAALVQPGSFDAIFVPGGVYGTSGLWVERAVRAGIRVCSYDTGGYGTVMIASNGIACQLQDIPTAFRLLAGAETSADERAFAVRSALAEVDKRRRGTDTFSSQIKGSTAADPRYDGAVLLALNSSWDSAALGLHTVFADNSTWIVETTRMVLRHTQARVLVRQHPAERLDFARTTDDYRELLHRHFGDDPRVVFIAAADPVNSYELLERVAAVVVYTSTIGIEAAMHGKPVLTPSRSYYSGLGFVAKATGIDDYLAKLVAAAEGRVEVTARMREDAHVCFYLTQCCNWVFSDFNPADLAKWSRVPLARYRTERAVQLMIRSLMENVPVAYLNHLERFRPARPAN